MAAFRNDRIPREGCRYSLIHRIGSDSMHGVRGTAGAATGDTGTVTSRTMLLLLVAMTGVAPISLYMLVPALPVLATTFGRDIGVAQMTVSLYMVGIALSQLIMGPLSDKFGRRHRHGGE